MIMVSINFNSMGLKAVRLWAGSLLTASLLLAFSSSPVTAQLEACDFLLSPEDLNTFPTDAEDEDRVVLGQLRDRPYVVLLTYRLQENLPAIRACIPDAFLTSSRLGSYVHIASYQRYRDAKDLARRISESLDIDVRVIHHSRLGRR